jgi:MFS family permease
MVGVGESYLSAFVLALGLGEVASGLVTTIPLLAGGAIQLVTPLGVRRLGSRRRWAVLCAALQAASFLPLAVGALAGSLPPWVIFTGATLYWAAGMAVGPAWNAWVEWLVPRSIRTGYFARRTSATQLALVFGLVLGGVVLHRASQSGNALGGFALLFGGAALCRFLSARLLATQSEVEAGARAGDAQGLSPLAALERVRSSPGARLLLYMLMLTTAVTIVSPYISAYMLVELGLPYWQYMTLIGSAILAKVVSLPLFPRLARRLGLVVLLRASWLGITATPLLWLASDSYPYLLGLHVSSGVFWAAHEYATFLLLFETIRVERRVAVLTVYNLANAGAMVGGSLCGGVLFDSWGGGGRGYLLIFGASALARMLAVLLLARVQGAGVRASPKSFRPRAVRPASA